MANTLWEKIEAKFSELKTQLTASNSTAPAADHSKTISDFRSQLDAFKLDLDAKDAEISTLTVAKTKAEADLKASQDAQAGFDAKVAAAASAKAGQIVGDLGHPPLAEGTKSQGSEKPDFSKLTGLDKVIAIEKYEAGLRAQNKK